MEGVPTEGEGSQVVIRHHAATSGGEDPFRGRVSAFNMESLTHSNPPLSPVLLAGMALSPLPPVLLQPFLNVVTTNISRRHPGLFDRLAGLANSTFLIDPIDLPFGFLLRPSPPPRLMGLPKPPRQRRRRRRSGVRC